jgi:AcrR family transcriptional regulator
MTGGKKTAEVRTKELTMAILRIQKGRSRIGETKLSIAAVAREADVSTALIHNHYPKIAERINTEAGRSGKKQLDAKQEKLKAEKQKSRGLRAELVEWKAKFAKLASINEVLADENRRLKVQLCDPKVVGLKDRRYSE